MLKQKVSQPPRLSGSKGSKGQKEQATVSISPTQLETTEFMPSDVSLRQHKIKAEVRKGKVENILPMVASKARDTLEKIPEYLHVWFDLDDLIAEGVNKAIAVVKEHKNDGPAGYTTYLFASLDNHFKDKLKEIFAEKRFVRGLYSLDSVMGKGVESNRGYTLGELLDQNIISPEGIDKKATKFTINEERIINRIDAERAFLRLYKHSSPKIRRYLVAWIIQPRNTKMKSLRYSKKKQKFIGDEELAKQLQQDFIDAYLTFSNVDTIIRDAECKRSICRAIIRKYRTPKTESSIRSPNLKDSLEYVLGKIAFAKW